MEIHGENKELDIEEIIKAATEAAAKHSKEWILKRIGGDRASEVPAQEGRSNDRASVSTRDEEEPQNEAKKQQRNTSRGAKKEAGSPGPSKRAKANTGEQISAIVQECLKSITIATITKSIAICEARWGKRHRRVWGGEPKGDITYSDTRENGVQTAKAAMPCEECPSPNRGEEEATPSGNRASPSQAWGRDNEGDRRRQHSPATEGLAPEAYKRGSLETPYMVARAPGLASMIPLAVKEQIWRREFINMFRFRSRA
ncbi:hypothetical protein NDU88_004264 [Pleurodeles waltl]|uniref:Uncharacterized protein n=1 Tax=Pleurodeles waltl TaxID=8319 RepID=A0AAV7TS42_PLEWA|nr:hypothetical protein NDU88_004264 [Pleurodeles waltl]